jgi:alpha-D-ribose 1-methylphosphonate 5-triphosphate synthase subunit PhnH
MTLAQEALTGGFENPVLDAQAVFRDLMDAMARPGTIRDLRVSAEAPAPFSTAQAAVALCLADHDTPVWLSPALRGEAHRGWIAFHCGAPVTMAMSEARFAFLAAGEPLPDFSGFASGTQEYPDRSATLVIELAGLSSGHRFVARGPGIDGECVIAPEGLPSDFAKRWRANRALFPRGLDLVLTCGSHILCLPRTTELQEMEG